MEKDIYYGRARNSNQTTSTVSGKGDIGVNNNVISVYVNVKRYISFMIFLVTKRK